MDIRRHMGKKVTELRELKGWSQEELGFESGFHRTYISQIERGVANPTLKNIQRVADSLSVPCWKLIEPM